MITDTLKIMDYKVAGTLQANQNLILLATDYFAPLLSDSFLAGTFHHELSSILLHKHKYSWEKWSVLIPKSFSFPKSDDDMLKATQNYDSDLNKYHELGFVSDYGASSLENDFNTYAELLFNDPSKLKELEKSHPIIQKKSNLVKEFYQSIAQRYQSEFEF